MFFGCNKISITNVALNFSLIFDPIEAIKSVSKSAEDVPIRIAASHADFWRCRSQSEVIFDYDWTYTPQSYTGTLANGGQSIEPDANVEINFNRLKQQDPILFFDENILYEDELGDNGISIISVKLVANMKILRYIPHGNLLFVLESHGVRFLRFTQSFPEGRPGHF